MREDRQIAPVFVYGTLRQGDHNHQLLTGAIAHLETPTTVAGFQLIGAGASFPWAIPASGDQQITGDLIDVDPPQWDSVLHRLDQLEGYRGPGRDNLYHRLTVTVTTRAGDREAWMYVAAHDLQSRAARPVPHGDWHHTHRHTSWETHFTVGSGEVA